MTYELICADNIELRNGFVKASYTDKDAAILAMHTEIALAKAEHGINDRIVRFTDFGDRISVDFGSWSDFIGLTGITMDDLN